ncbi:molybdopterin-dependent oxidoreductase [Carboxydothermus ferrireducens]|uniref:Anaerobic selenocysteine-containing dehydrogenase n=1 Tax=Carboxydothermus ferrireducens DSM 11255 TaxID=1119529 RepID=A0ABX2R6H6_9THEO|nr:molybdopterin-dependent oxidoreductase [Carboxydothermus ferrireducens]NYE56777.1 anaerobic selenocysteine-containing dehydrogenase [Carboxydothermus ferrireducens DSM 11255]
MKKITRRKFLKASAVVGGSAALLGGSELSKKVGFFSEAEAATSDKYPLDNPENIIYSVCLQCNTGCPIKVKIQNGLAAKIDGNPYSPWTMTKHIPYNTPVADVAKLDGAICPKGQAGIQTVYDPYRIKNVLKRAGKRGENKWITISFEQALEEIINGGKIFAHVPGEENRVVPGLKDIYALTDPALSKAMAEDVKKIQDKTMTVEEFKAKYADHLDKLINPDMPDLGPKNNQFVFSWGRLKDGRADLIKRFAAALGTVNALGHTTVCQGSLYFTGKAMSEQYDYDASKKKVDWTGGEKFYWQADVANSEFVIFVGASPFEANYGPSHRAAKIVDGVASGRLKYVVVDPRYSKAAAHAWKWLPIKPGEEAALALALIQKVFELNGYDAKFLAAANKAAATAIGEPTWSNATWLVKIENGQPTVFLRGSEVGLAKITKKAADGTTYELDPMVVLSNGTLTAVDPNSTDTPVTGELFVNQEVTLTNGQTITVKSSLQLLYEEANKKSFEEWCAIAGLDPVDVEEVAEEFVKHGKKAAADVHRGVSQHTNGFYNVGTWFNLNLLLGNFDWKGGMVKASTYSPNSNVAFNTSAHPGKITTFGIDIVRSNTAYEKTLLFARDGYPAKRPWFTLASDVYQEIVPSIGDQYPHPYKVLFTYMGTTVYSVPGGHKNIEILRDTEKLPLFVAIDIIVGETSMYADYIIPDLTYLERWEFHGSHPSIIWKVQPVRQPAVKPLTPEVTVYGNKYPLGLEAFLLGIAERMNLPGFGPDGFGAGIPFTHPDHLYLRQVANIALGGKADLSEAVPEADDREIEIFKQARKHLPASVYDYDRWKSIVGDTHWRRVVYLLNRGGRFDDYDKAFDGEKVKNKYGKQINIYQEKTAKTINSQTGKKFLGLPQYISPYRDSRGNELKDKYQGYTFNLITYKDILHTKSRTISNYWSLEVQNENYVLINRRDALRLGLKDGDKVRVRSASNPEGIWDLGNGQKVPMVGKVKVIEGIREGVVAFSLGFGHWAYGASDIVIDGKVVKGDPRRKVGIHANAAMRLDPYVNGPLSDLPGGSVVFYDTRVKLTRE